MKRFCGAQNSNSFKAVFSQTNPMNFNFKVPEITYEGVFSEHFFKIQSPNKNELVQLETHYAFTQSLLSKNNFEKPELWASCFIKSSKDGDTGAKDRNNMPIDISVMLDISGSMSSPLTYDNNSQEKNISKLELSKQAVLKFIQESLNEDDKFSLGIFNNQAYQVQKMDFLQNIDQIKLQDDINKLKPCGGTTLSSGLSAAIQEYQQEQDQKQKDKQFRNKRILFITDMLSMDAIELQGLISMASDLGVYISIIGVGVSFDTQVTDIISKNRGCNYFSVTKNEELEEIIVTEFISNYFPIAFNVDLKMQTEDFDIVEVYGTPFATQQKEQLNDNLKQFQAVSEINTLFSTPLSEQGSKGGLILLKISPKIKDFNINQLQQKQLKFHVNYQESPLPDSEVFSQEISLNLGENQLQNDENNQQLIYSNGAILKGILLQKYVEFCKNHTNEQYLKKNYDNKEDLKSNCQQFKEIFEQIINQHSLGEKIQEIIKLIENLSNLSEKLYEKQNDDIQIQLK